MTLSRHNDVLSFDFMSKSSRNSVTNSHGLTRTANIGTSTVVMWDATCQWFEASLGVEPAIAKVINIAAYRNNGP